MERLQGLWTKWGLDTHSYVKRFTFDEFFSKHQVYPPASRMRSYVSGAHFTDHFYALMHISLDTLTHPLTNRNLRSEQIEIFLKDFFASAKVQRTMQVAAGRTSWASIGPVRSLEVQELNTKVAHMGFFDKLKELDPPVSHKLRQAPSFSHDRFILE